jgi:hypothetical protein
VNPDHDVPEVIDKLQALGSAAQIADFFAAEGITGQLKEAERCPVANYIARETGCADTLVDHLFVTYGSDTAKTVNQISWVEIGGTPVGEFVADFDHGRYPKLTEDGGS